MLALAVGLRQDGHRVTLVASPENKAWVETSGCDFLPFGRDVLAFIHQQSRVHTLGSAVAFNMFVRQAIKEQLYGLDQVIQGADLVVGASLMFGLSSVAERYRIPYRYIVFSPQLLPSAHHPFPALKSHGRPFWFNRLSWEVARMTDRFNFNLLINRYRRSMGLSLVSDIWRHILGERVLVASDPVLGGVPADVRENTCQSGYLHLSHSGPLDSVVAQFIADGPAPVFIGFGSMPRKDQQAHQSLVYEAIKLSGVRAIVAGGFGNGGVSPLNNKCFSIGNCPHGLLFPHMAGVIHHGGAGTTATTALAGVPQVIVPHILDQYYWAHQIHSLAIGPQPIWRVHLTAKRLAAAIRACLDTSVYRHNATALSELIRRQMPIAKAKNYLLT